MLVLEQEKTKYKNYINDLNRVIKEAKRLRRMERVMLMKLYLFRR